MVRRGIFPKKYHAKISGNPPSPLLGGLLPGVRSINIFCSRPCCTCCIDKVCTDENKIMEVLPVQAMTSFMVLSISLGRKFFRTVQALVRFISCVDPHVYV